MHETRSFQKLEVNEGNGLKLEIGRKFDWASFNLIKAHMAYDI